MATTLSTVQLIKAWQNERHNSATCKCGTNIPANAKLCFRCIAIRHANRRK